jgi:hypothetical protein
VGFVADKLALGWIYSNYFGFSCQLIVQTAATFTNHPITQRYAVSTATASLNKQLERKKYEPTG